MALDCSLSEMKEKSLLFHLVVADLCPSEDKLRENILMGVDSAEMTEEMLNTSRGRDPIEKTVF